MALCAASNVTPPAVGCMIKPPNTSTPRCPSSSIASAAKPELFWKLSISPTAFMPAAAACRTESSTFTERPFRCGQECTWQSIAPSK